MHCELVVPALFASHEIPRLPSLELLLARGRMTRQGPLALEAWLAEAFGLAESAVPVGAFTAHAAAADLDARSGHWLRADPVHLRLGRGDVTLIPSAGFAISRSEADAFVAALNRHFGAEYLFLVAQPGQWCVRSAGQAAFESPSPLEWAGREVESGLLHGPDAARWHALMNEIQMVLHDHPLNGEREQRGDPAVNSVWLWGAGPLPEAVRGRWHSVTADDALAAGLARLAGVRQRALPAGAEEWLGRAPDEGRHLVVLDGLRAVLALSDAGTHGERVAALEARWFTPLLDALRRSRIGMVTIHVPDSGQACETARNDLRRFWRRARPLATYA